MNAARTLYRSQCHAWRTWRRAYRAWYITREYADFRHCDDVIRPREPARPNWVGRHDPNILFRELAFCRKRVVETRDAPFANVGPNAYRAYYAALSRAIDVRGCVLCRTGDPCAFHRVGTGVSRIPTPKASTVAADIPVRAAAVAGEGQMGVAA